MVRLAGVFALVLLGIAVYTLAQGGNDPSLNPIALAAARTQHSPGARFSFHGSVEGRSLQQTLTMTGSGLLNGQTNRVQITETVGHPGTGTLQMEGVGSGGQFYYRSNAFGHGLPSGDEWVGFDSTLGASSEAPIPSGSGPGAELAQLRAVSSKFETLGKEKIRGVETTAYRSTFDFNGLADHLRSEGADKAAQEYEQLAEKVPTTTEVVTWIDGRNLIRRMKLTAHSLERSSGERTVTVATTDFFDFGISPEIQLPNADTVYDITPKIQAQLGLSGSG